MDTLLSDPADDQLLLANMPWRLWRLLENSITVEDWCEAMSATMSCLAGLPATDGSKSPLETIVAILGEDQFGPHDQRLSAAKRMYYTVRPILPGQVRSMLRHLLLPRRRRSFPLGWPVEDRYVRFQFQTVRRLLATKGMDSVPYVHFWPGGKSFAFVLTHDVESAQGQQFVSKIATLEESLGFRSSFNFVAEDYQVDLPLLRELRERGFEVGVHGLKHDGKLFSSKTSFMNQVPIINQYLKSWGAVGFRSPSTHRHPEWMQALEVEYDSSFFDTDPYEPISGGTMSIWPFFLGRFVEMPYTLPQDHVVLHTLCETTPKVWLDKVDFVEKHYGMALVNTHPDYLRTQKSWAVYEDFLSQMHQRAGYWHALPGTVARWWRERANITPTWDGSRWIIEETTDACVGQIHVTSGESCLSTDPAEGVELEVDY